MDKEMKPGGGGGASAQSSPFVANAAVQYSGWFNFNTILGWGSFCGSGERGAGLCFGALASAGGLWRSCGFSGPVSTSSLPISLSRGSGRSGVRTIATTARYGRDSAAAGQGTRVRSRRRAEEARPPRGTRGGSSQSGELPGKGKGSSHSLCSRAFDLSRAPVCLGGTA